LLAAPVITATYHARIYQYQLILSGQKKNFKQRAVATRHARDRFRLICSKGFAAILALFHAANALILFRFQAIRATIDFLGRDCFHACHALPFRLHATYASIASATPRTSFHRHADERFAVIYSPDDRCD